MAGTHEIAARILASADEVARRFLDGIGHAYGDELAQTQQPRQALAIPAVGLDAVARSTRDLRGRRTVHAIPACAQARASPYRVRSRLVGHPHRPWQRLELRHRLLARRPHALRAQLAASGIEHAREHRACVHIQSNPATFAHIRRLP